MTTGEEDRAIETLILYKQTYPRLYHSRVLLSGSYGEIGQWEKSISECREALALNPNNIYGYTNEAKSLVALNRFGEAKDTYAQALQRRLDTTDIHAGLFQIAFIESDPATMQRQIDWARGQPDEYRALDWQAGTAAFSGQLRRAQEFSQRAIDLATRSNVKSAAAREAAEQALRAAVFEKCDQARAAVAQSLTLERNQVTLSRSALALALCGEAKQTQSLSDELVREYPKDTLVNMVWLPTIRAASELLRGSAPKAVELLQETRGYDPAAEFWTRYLRGQAYLKLDKGSEAVAEFNQILEHRGEAPLSVLYPLAQLGLARVARRARDISQARQAYEDFLNTWKDADSDLPILVAARAENTRLN